MRLLLTKTSFAVILSLVLLLLCTGVISAISASWMSTSAVELSKKELLKVTPFKPAPFSFLSNKQECVDMKFNIDNIRMSSVCVVRVANGLVSNDGYVLLHGSTVARKLTSSSTKHVSFIPLRDSSKIVELKQVSNKLVASIVSDAYILPASQYGSVKYELPFATKTEQFVQFGGTNVQLYSSDAISVSKNGKWLAGETASGFFVYNIEASSFRFVKTAYLNSSDITAISDDGRYLVTANKLGKFEITDTEQCENTSPQNGSQAKCAAVNYYNNIKQYMPTLATDVSIKKIHFDNNSQISFYATHDYVNNTDHVISKVTMSLPDNSVKSYLALGDSFASGEGAYNYREGTDFADNRCHLSLDSYPYLLNNTELGFVQSVACSGAKTIDYSYWDSEKYNKDEKQAKGKEDRTFDFEVYQNYLPGYRTQDNFVKLATPSVVTVSIGGNDIGFSKIVQTCVLSVGDCFDYYEERAALVGSINNTYSSLVDTYTKIKEQSAKDAHIYVLGYPEIAKQNGNCAANVHLSNKEIQLGNDITAYLNSVIEKAATHAGVKYVDVSKTLYGRRLCETDSKDAAVNGLTSGNSAPLAGIGPIASESFHPNKKGHEMYAEVIKQATDNFNATMPAPSESNPKDTPLDSISFVAEAPKKGSSIFDTYYNDGLTEDVIFKDRLSTIELNSDEYALRRDTPVVFELHSTPTSLGSSLPVDGVLTKTMSLTNTIEPGYHTLHAYGTTIDNSVIDIQKIVYVAASETDYDGDGIKNEDERCLAGSETNTDIDGDGIDDACDGFIGEPKATTKELPQSESRPDWLLMKERDNAYEQAAANQSATVTLATTDTSAITNSRVSNIEQSTSSDIITTQPLEREQSNPQVNNGQNTTVAGVSSAIESKPQTHSGIAWYIYAFVLIGVLAASLGFYRAISVKNRV